MSAQEYKIKAVASDTRTYSTKFGDMVSYKVLLDGMNTPVELAQKVTTAAPVEGQELYGRIEDTQWGAKFKKEQRQQGFAGTDSAPAGRPSYKKSGKSFESDPYTMYLSYAKDVAVALASSNLLVDAKGKINGELFNQLLELVDAGGKKLHKNRLGAEQTATEDTKEITTGTSESSEPSDEDFRAAIEMFDLKPDDER